MAAERPQVSVDAAEHRAVLERFLAAAQTGDLDGLVAVLAENVVHVSDGGPSRRAARHPIRGRDRVSRFVAKVGPKGMTGTVEVTALNGEMGFLVHERDEVHLACTVVIDGGLVRTVHWVLNPDKLAWL